MSAKKKVKINVKALLLHYFYCVAVIVLLTIAGANLNNYLSSQKVLAASIDVSPLQEEKIFWQTVVTQTPSYIDGYLQLAKVEVELGNKNEALTYLQQALSLDPNSTKIVEVQNRLGL